MNTALKLIRILTTILIGFIPVFVLYNNYASSLGIKNGFNRRFIEPPTITKILNLQYKGYYFSGRKDSVIYLSHSGAPAHIKEFNWNTSKVISHEFEIFLEEPNSLKWRAMTVQVEYPNVYFAVGPNGIIIKKPIPSKNNIGDRSFVKLDSVFFDRFTVIDSSYFVIRNYNRDLGQNVLSKVSPNGESHFVYKPRKQIDGVFDTDGILLDNNMLFVYLFYYRNQFLVMNKDLNHPVIHQTIDTNSQAKITLKYVNQKKQMTFSEPPLRVNKKGYIDETFIYINSNLKADNEKVKKFNTHSVIDLYSLKEGSYIHSFYLPEIKNKKADDFIVKGKNIIAIYDNQLVILKMNQN